MKPRKTMVKKNKPYNATYLEIIYILTSCFDDALCKHLCLVRPMLFCGYMLPVL